MYAGLKNVCVISLPDIKKSIYFSQTRGFVFSFVFWRSPIIQVSVSIPIPDFILRPFDGLPNLKQVSLRDLGL